MVTKRERKTVLRELPADWETQFAHLGHGTHVTCLICGSHGYPGEGNRPMGWQIAHLHGHPDECPRCGALFVRGSGGYVKHLNIGPDCVGSKTTQYGRLQWLLDEEEAMADG